MSIGRQVGIRSLVLIAGLAALIVGCVGSVQKSGGGRPPVKTPSRETSKSIQKLLEISMVPAIPVLTMSAPGVPGGSPGDTLRVGHMQMWFTVQPGPANPETMEESSDSTSFLYVANPGNGAYAIQVRPRSAWQGRLGANFTTGFSVVEVCALERSMAPESARTFLVDFRYNADSTDCRLGCRLE